MLAASEALARWAPFVLQGFLLNVLMSAVAILIGTALGVGLGAGQLARGRTARVPASVATQVFRNAPWLVLLFYCIFLVPYQVSLFGTVVTLPSWLRATLGFTVPVAANVSEIVRGAVGSVPSGQWEAAEALGYGRGATLMRIVLPQCVARMVPPWMNLYALLITATPLASIVGVEEALSRTQAALQSEGQPGLLMPMYGALLVLFFLYSYPVSRFSRAVERRFHRI